MSLLFRYYYCCRPLVPSRWLLSRGVDDDQVTAAGVALPGAYLKKEFASLAMLLVPGMIWMWLLSGLSVWAVVPGLNFVDFRALVLGLENDPDHNLFSLSLS